MKGVVFIDGENFLSRIREVFRKKNISDFNITTYDFAALLDDVFDTSQSTYPRRFYRAKPERHRDILEYSEKIIQKYRTLGGYLHRLKFDVIRAGTLRADYREGVKTEYPRFREKGVDVRLAVDMVTMACDGLIDEALLVASDSDYQPAVAELRKRGVRVVYVGFEINPNHGLIAKTDDRYIIANKLVLKHAPNTLFRDAA